MAGLNRGLSFLKEQQEAAAERQAAKDNPIWKLWVSSGDTARYWHLVKDVDTDMKVPLVHSMEKTVMQGPRKGNKFQVDVLCQRDSFEDPEEDCEYCMEAVPGPWYRLITWVYVDQILHATNTKDKDGKWELKKRGTGKIYVETPEPNVRMLIMKTRLTNQVMARYEEYGTLYDRYYKLEKTGSGQQTVELLLPDSEIAVPAEVEEAYRNLMPLEDAIRQEFGRFTTKPKSREGRGQREPQNFDEVAADDDEEAIDFE